MLNFNAIWVNILCGNGGVSVIVRISPFDYPLDIHLNVIRRFIGGRVVGIGLEEVMDVERFKLVAISRAYAWGCRPVLLIGDLFIGFALCFEHRFFERARLRESLVGPSMRDGDKPRQVRMLVGLDLPEV